MGRVDRGDERLDVRAHVDLRGVGRGVAKTGGLLQRIQSGGVQNYALFILLAVLVIGVIVGAQYAVMVVGLIAVGTTVWMMML